MSKIKFSEHCDKVNKLHGHLSKGFSGLVTHFHRCAKATADHPDENVAALSEHHAAAAETCEKMAQHHADLSEQHAAMGGKVVAKAEQDYLEQNSSRRCAGQTHQRRTRRSSPAHGEPLRRRARSARREQSRESKSSERRHRHFTRARRTRGLDQVAGVKSFPSRRPFPRDGQGGDVASAASGSFSRRRAMRAFSDFSRGVPVLRKFAVRQSVVREAAEK